MEAEAHAREARAAIVGREALVIAGLVDDRVQRRLHAGHGIDHAGERGDVERVHHRRRGHREADRAIDRRSQFVDRGDAVFRIDEQPLPIERDDLHLERLAGAVGTVADLLLVDQIADRHVVRERRRIGLDPAERAIRIEQMRAGPGQRAERDDDQQRHAPDQQLEADRVIPVGLVLGGLVRLAIAEREEQGQKDHRNDDQQHQPGRDQHQIALLHCDIAGGRHHNPVATAGEQCQGHGNQPFSGRDFGAGKLCHDGHSVPLRLGCAALQWTICPMGAALQHRHGFIMSKGSIDCPCPHPPEQRMVGPRPEERVEE